MTMIMLHAIPITSLPQVVKLADTPPPYQTRINCVLQCGPLPEYQHLEVYLNETQLYGVPEGGQMVFSWQLLTGSDEIRMVLLSNGVPTKRWRGCWNGRDALLHVGPLPVKVVFNGKRQHATETVLLSPPQILRQVSKTEVELPARPAEGEQELRGGTQRVVADVLVLPAPRHSLADAPDASERMASRPGSREVPSQFPMRSIAAEHEQVEARQGPMSENQQVGNDEQETVWSEPL